MPWRAPDESASPKGASSGVAWKNAAATAALPMSESANATASLVAVAATSAASLAASPDDAKAAASVLTNPSPPLSA